MRVASPTSALLAMVLAGCGGDAATPASDAACSGGRCDGGVAVPEGVTRWFAIRQLQLGLTDRAGRLDLSAWRQYGWNLDGRVTTAVDSEVSANSCRRRDGSQPKVLADGDDGRDNNYGQHVLAVLRSIESDVQAVADAQITNGSRTLLLRLDNVTGIDDPSVPGALYVAGDRGSPPAWDGADVWPIDSSSLDADDRPLAVFPKGYLIGGFWVSDAIGTTIPFPLPGLLGMASPVPLEGAVIAVDVKTGANGTIGGAVAVERLLTAYRPSFESLGFCAGSSTWDQLVATITQSTDLVSGAPQLQDTSRTCDAISIGLGFVAAPVQPPTSIVIPPPGPPSGCR